MALVGFNRSMVMKLTLALALSVGAAHAMAFEPDPLKGPKVKDSGVPGEDRKFGGGGDGKFDKENILPHRLFMRSMEVLRGEKAGALRLSEDQSKQIKAVEDDFAKVMDAYRAEHRDEARTLIKDLAPEDRRRAMELLGPDGPKGERGGERMGDRGPRPGKDGEKGQHPERRAGRDGEKGERPMDDGPMGDGPKGDGEHRPSPEKAEAAKARLKELFEAAPKPDEVHSKVFAILTADQKAAVEKQLDLARKEMQERRQEMYKDRVKKDIKGKMDEKGKDGAGKDMDPAKIREFIQSLPADEREKIKDMDPKERREYVHKLWESKKN